jgi:serine/threonine protein kinase
MLVIKEVSIDHMNQKEQEETIKEAQILRNFKHPLIVRFVEVYATKQNKLKIVMEYAECGDLSKAIANRRNEKKTF